MKGVGILLFVIGLVGLVYGFLMPVTVEDVDRVVNIGLLNTRQNIIFVFAIVFAVGFLTFQLGVFLDEQSKQVDRLIKELKPGTDKPSIKE